MATNQSASFISHMALSLLGVIFQLNEAPVNEKNSHSSERL